MWAFVRVVELCLVFFVLNDWIDDLCFFLYYLVVKNKKHMDRYYRECFRFPSRRIYLDSESANIITNRGDCIFQLNNTIALPVMECAMFNWTKRLCRIQIILLMRIIIHSLLLILMQTHTLLRFRLEITMQIHSWIELFI